MSSRLYLDVHALQNVPPSNINRDDTGAPKTAQYGGVTRARVSSQAWKRATRKYFDTILDPSELGVRTKKVAEVLAKRITERDPAIPGEKALEIAAEVLRTATGTKIEPPKRKVDKAKKEGGAAPAPESAYLMFLSARQLEALAELAVEGADNIKEFLKDKDTKNQAKHLADSRHSVDIALFGRMVADSADVNVDAACQVAHALSVHETATESDYYTAVDDENEEDESGAGMIGTVDFNSATLYRYASVNVRQLSETLGVGLDQDQAVGEPARRAVAAFVEGFVASLPTGKINSFGNHTLPDAVVVKLRTSRPVSFVSAFERPVTAHSASGHLEGAAERLAEYVPEIERAYGDETTATWVLRLGHATQKLSALGTEVPGLEELAEVVSRAVTDRTESGA